MRIAGFGWRPQHFDHRDWAFAPRLAIPSLPSSVDLCESGFMPAVYDQGQLGSCVGNATASAIEFLRRKEGLKVFTPSRLMIYYDARKMEGTVASDAGCEIRDAVKSVAIAGVCDEAEWPYDISQFAVAPSNQAYLDALKDRVVQYEAIDNSKLDLIRAALAEGLPVIFGVTVYQAFEEVGADGIVPTPETGWFHRLLEPPLGGHAMKIVGYDDASKRFKVKNSWGVRWGAQGFCFMGYDYLSSAQASDFWALRMVSP